MPYLVMYGEIGTKGKNRGFFERKLAENIQEQTGMKTKRIMGRILATGGEPEKLKKVFGVTGFAKAVVCEQDIDKIGGKALSELKKMKGKTMKVITSRADKSFPKNSMQISKEVGEILYNAGYKGDMENPDITVFVEFIEGKAYVYFKKQNGPGGLPVGSSGKIVSLLSGGIDSPVSTWYAMKRGCEPICLHVHAFNKNKKAEESKMKKLVQALSEYSPSVKCYFVPYYIYQSMALEVPGKYELAVFRRFLLKLAERICEKEKAKAIYTGDSMGQVASQTLENLRGISTATKMPIMRPLIGFDKEEIICTAKYINTYNISVQKYKDPCSVVAKHPATRPKPKYILEAEKMAPMDRIIEESLKESSFIEIP